MKQLWTPIVNPIKTGIQKQLDAGGRRRRSIAADSGTTPGHAGRPLPAHRSQAASRAKGSLTAVEGVEWSARRSGRLGERQPAQLLRRQADPDPGQGDQEGQLEDEQLGEQRDERHLVPERGGPERSPSRSWSASTPRWSAIYWIGSACILLAFILSLFFKVPPLRQRSALQERADEAGVTETGSIQAQVRDVELEVAQS